MDATKARTIADGYIPLIITLAKRVSRRLNDCVPLEELISYGAEGAMQAIYRYEPSKGKVMTYIYPRIVGAMLDGVRTAKGSRHSIKKRGIMNDIREELTRTLERPPLEDEICQALKDRGCAWHKRPLSYAAMRQGYEQWAEKLVDRHAPDPASVSAHQDTISWLLDGLNASDRAVAELRLGGHDMAAIGRVIGLSMAGASSRWKRVKAHLRERIGVAA
jgi:RNA polymerase sigma factor (sigma-70 family)